MPENTANIVGTTHASFTIVIDCSQIVAAFLESPSQPKVELEVEESGREVKVADLPKGDSTVRLDMVWAPGDAGAMATVDVGNVANGTVNAKDPKRTIEYTEMTGYVDLFGI